MAVTESGRVYSFLLSEAYNSHGGHISTSSQHGPIESLIDLNIQRARILPMGRCDQCKCCIVAITDNGELYICSTPSNQERWMQHQGGLFVKGLSGNFKCAMKSDGFHITSIFFRL